MSIKFNVCLNNGNEAFGTGKSIITAKMNKQDLRQKALETIKECKEIIGQYLSGTIGLDENVRQAFAKYNSAMRTRYFTSDDISIEQKQAYHRRMVKRMRREGLHRMTDEEWKNRLTNKKS